MTGRSRFTFLCLLAVLLCVVNFAISPEVSAKPKQGGGSGNGKALGKLKEESLIRIMIPVFAVFPSLLPNEIIR